MLLEFRRGAAYPFRAVGFLARRPALWGWAAAPFLLLLGALGNALAITFITVPTTVTFLTGQPEQAGLAALWWFGVLLLSATLFGLVAVVLWFIANLAASPFYDVLAAKVEAELLGTIEDDAFHLRRVLGDAWMSIRHSLAWFGLWLLIVLPLLLLHLVPGIGSLLNAIGSFGATVFFVSRELMDVPLSRRRTAFRDKLRYLRAHRARVLPMGAVVAVALMVPLANLVIMPVAVVGASLLFCEAELEADAVVEDESTR